MLTTSEIKSLLQSNSQVVIAVIGDSTTMGFGANPSPNVWPTNGLSYGCMNNPTFGRNWDSGDSAYINTSGFITDAQQDNVSIVSGTRLLRNYIESMNPSSKVYNFGASGFTAAAHIASNTVAAVAAKSPKPQVVFIALGINSAKNNQSQDADLRNLVSQVLANNMLPVLVKPNNIGVAGSPSGSWSATATPDQWFPMDNWPSIRANIDVIAQDNNLDVIDLGTPSGLLDITLLYDSFHPSNLGYQEIFNRYKAWLEEGMVIADGPVRLKFDTVAHQINASGALKIKYSSGVIGLNVTDSESATKINTSTGIKSIL